MLKQNLRKENISIYLKSIFEKLKLESDMVFQVDKEKKNFPNFLVIIIKHIFLR